MMTTTHDHGAKAAKRTGTGTRTGWSSTERRFNALDSTSRPATPGLHGRVLERVDENVHRVLESVSGGQHADHQPCRQADQQIVVGFIEEVGAVFVSLAGSRYDVSVEIAQSLSLERAVLAFSQRR